ncbi:MAG: phosphoglyceromutase [Blastocatellia bacterium]
MFVLLLIAEVSAQSKTRNVVLITLDGVRTQEMFGGLDAEVFKSADKNFEKSAAYKRFWAATPEQRREKLMPFFWGTLMNAHGSVAGNRDLKSSVQTTNKLWFSYPGYSEILTGQAHDDVINSNDHPQNPYPSVLDFLNRKLATGPNAVAEFSSWDAFMRIATNKPGSFVVNAAYETYPAKNREIEELLRLQSQVVSPWPSVRHDYFTFKIAQAHMKQHRTRAIHIGFDETDDYAHDKNYERVLDSLHLTDSWIKELWEFLQSDPRYRGKTSMIITVDHGRGNSVKDWSDHGEDVPEAQHIWMAFISPDSSLRGEWENAETIYQNQAAATLCKFLRLDYREQNPNAGGPVSKLFAKH